jgi:hypothetical protein
LELDFFLVGGWERGGSSGGGGGGGGDGGGGHQGFLVIIPTQRTFLLSVVYSKSVLLHKTKLEQN